MPEPITKTTEERLAAERNDQSAKGLTAKRTRYLALAVALLLLSGGIASVGLWMIALISFVLGLIFLSQYFDANGHLHEVQRRSTKTLVRDFSVLRRPEGGSPTKARPMSR
jgi:Flp pilus assembly protein TadB